MDFSRWRGGGSRRDTGPGQSPRGRIVRGLKPSCEALDGRQLLSTAAAPVALSTPPATAVAAAATDLNALNSSTFTQFQNDLAKAEGDSHVTEAQVDKLAQDEAALQQVITSAGLDPTTVLGHLDLQDVVAGAFRESPAEVAKRRAPLDKYVLGVPGGPQLVRKTIDQMQVVSQATRTPTPLRDSEMSDWQTLSSLLGSNPDTDLGPGATHRDPLEVYFNGQLSNFVKG
jgi:hypothetical protein